MKILLVEDDEHTVDLLSNALTSQHFLVNSTNEGQTALALAKTYDYDLILLDVMIPGLDGLSLCRQLRTESYSVPILMLTAKDSSSDRIAGLEAGADDYVAKPFVLAELMARIRALLRRSRETLPEVLRWENLQLNTQTSEVSYNGELLHLTPKEYGLLELFLRHPGRIFSRAALLDRVWNIGEFPGERAVTTQIKGLRQKLKTAGMTTDLIESIYGLGYRLKLPVTQTEKKQDAKTSSDSPPLSPNEIEVLTELTTIWQNFQTSLAESFALFEQVAVPSTPNSLHSDKPDPELRQQARTVAHRLIGSLGTLGVAEGSTVARQLEQLLQAETPWENDQRGQFSHLVEKLKHLVVQSPPPFSLTVPRPATAAAPRDDPMPSALAGHLLVIDDDDVLAEQIKTAALSQGLQTDIAPSLNTARALMAQQHPDVILLDLSFPDSPETGLTFLEELAEQHLSIPVLVITGRNELSDRIEVSRLGGWKFWQKPIAIDQLMRAVLQALNPEQRRDAKVMVVDDDPHILVRVSDLLEPWGLQVITLANPQQFWECLETHVPDLLILDIELPQLSGFELCQVVRHDARWGGIPVLFLSAHTDADTVRQVFIVGADDYVSKPIVEAELIARVLNRLERVKSRR
jgi:DNA-binding response OmpR family regulator